MKILGIETSCDETAISLMDARGGVDEDASDFQCTILGNALISQAQVHAKYGGVFPNLAKREHSLNLVPLLGYALTEAFPDLYRLTKSIENPVGEHDAELKKILDREPELYEYLSVFLTRAARPDIDCIAVTAGPGLEPALWVGVNFARALSRAWSIPIVAVNHMEGHVLIALLRNEDSEQLAVNSEQKKATKASFVNCKLSSINFPMLALLISGGHTELVLSEEFLRYELLGQTRDDAAGEAFDKVARLLGLPYPGGPHVSALAERARKIAEQTQKNAGKILRDSASSLRGSALRLPRPMLRDDSFDFSFAGLKTAVRNIVEGSAPLSDDMRLSLAREFEDAVAEVLVKKTARAARERGARTIVVGGGVSANERIRSELARELSATNCKLFLPEPELATDNAIMIALAGYFHAARGKFAEPDSLKADGNLRLA